MSLTHTHKKNYSLIIIRQTTVNFRTVSFIVIKYNMCKVRLLY